MNTTYHLCRTPRHFTFYTAAGPADGPLVVFLHGWPELGLSWQLQLRCFADLGWRAVAPDMRGYGRSRVPGRHADYALEEIVQDMLELLFHLGRDRCVWVGHDWGAPVVWTLASHHPDRCKGVAALCLPHFPAGFAPCNLIPLVDRQMYPEDAFPAGQWDYMLFYEERFEHARRTLEADVSRTLRSLMRAGSPKSLGRASLSAALRREGGWFGGADRAPDVPLDTRVLSEAQLSEYVAALEANGFTGPNSWYMNADRNVAYARQSPNGGCISVPALFVHATYDRVCDTSGTRLTEPMRAACSDLEERSIDSGHWIQLEQPQAVNRALVEWTVRKDLWS